MCQILYKSEELLHIVLVPWGTPFTDASHFVHVCMYTSIINDVAEAIHSFGVKIAFLFFQEKLRLAQLIKYKPEVFLMLSYGITEHEYIIQIYVYKSPDEFSEDRRH
jgi:hypothetical protein